MYAFLNVFFFIFHSSLIIFNLCGWMWKKTRRANLVILLLTAFSWFFLGIWYGYGYCPSTDWHWQVRMKLGYDDRVDSYTKFLIDKLTGLDVRPKYVDILTLVLLVIALFASIVTNVRDRKKSKHALPAQR